MEVSFLQYFTHLFGEAKILKVIALAAPILSFAKFVISMYLETQEEKVVFYKRNIIHIFLVIITAILCLYLFSLIPAKLSWAWLVILIAIFYTLYLYSFIMSLKNCSTLYSNRILNKYYDYLKDGTAIKKMEFTRSMPKCIVFVYDKFRYMKMCCEYHIANSDVQSAYSTLQKLKEFEGKLYKDEIDSLYMYMAYVLTDLGALNQAKECLNKVSSVNSIFLVELSRWQEQIGDIESSFETLERAKNLAPFTDELNIEGRKPSEFSLKEKNLAKHKSVFYNNIGRHYWMQQKPQKALEYYKKALNISIAAVDDIRCLHNYYSNVIDQLIIQKASDKEISKYYNDYRKCIEKQSLTNKIAFYNFKLGADRQRNIIDDEHQQFFQMYTELLKEAEGENKYSLEICAFITLFYYGEKAKHELISVINDINIDFDYYQELDLLKKFNVYKDLLFTLEICKNQLYPNCQDICNRIKKYYKTTALEEITEKLQLLDEYQIYYRCNLILNEIFIKSRNDNYKEFPALVDRFNDILEEYKKERWYFPTLDIYLFIAEECTVIQLCDENDKTRYPEIMTKYTDLAIEAMKMAPMHPETYILHLRAAWCLYFLNRTTEAQEHLKYFESNKISVNVFPKNIREKYYELKKNLPGRLLFLLMGLDNRVFPRLYA